MLFQNVPEEFVQLIDKFKEKLDEIVRAEIGDVVVQFVFVGQDEISEMNAKFRGKEGPTDVLTFVYGTEDSEFEPELPVELEEGQREIYAESYVCPSVVEENAREFGNSTEHEMITVLVHSILHMAGYDHEYGDVNAKEMFEKQENYVQKLLCE
ncbi:rRNA maturation RNase YbeY [Fervidobacterium thailandense]|uniref:Endoribonuclease YbeY n=1 Tax=Fervidobacterium thailandense TaxID=1008305 RepID=A0A1E3G5R2_9BACT|nr:rRNA maturation RNase YbeY [Fervidobacterium thailandense]ODN31203.1 rRNA maturation RNase YbeY [Fervidobacterium thailandense]